MSYHTDPHSKHSTLHPRTLYNLGSSSANSSFSSSANHLGGAAAYKAGGAPSFASSSGWSASSSGACSLDDQLSESLTESPFLLAQHVVEEYIQLRVRGKVTGGVGSRNKIMRTLALLKTTLPGYYSAPIDAALATYAFPPNSEPIPPLPCSSETPFRTGSKQSKLLTALKMTRGESTSYIREAVRDYIYNKERSSALQGKKNATARWGLINSKLDQLVDFVKGLSQSHRILLLPLILEIRLPRYITLPVLRQHLQSSTITTPQAIYALTSYVTRRMTLIGRHATSLELQTLYDQLFASGTVQPFVISSFGFVRNGVGLARGSTREKIREVMLGKALGGTGPGGINGLAAFLEKMRGAHKSTSSAGPSDPEILVMLEQGLKEWLMIEMECEHDKRWYSDHRVREKAREELDKLEESLALASPDASNLFASIRTQGRLGDDQLIESFRSPYILGETSTPGSSRISGQSAAQSAAPSYTAGW